MASRLRGRPNLERLLVSRHLHPRDRDRGFLAVDRPTALRRHSDLLFRRHDGNRRREPRPIFEWIFRRDRHDVLRQYWPDRLPAPVRRRPLARPLPGRRLLGQTASFLQHRHQRNSGRSRLEHSPKMGDDRRAGGCSRLLDIPRLRPCRHLTVLSQTIHPMGCTRGVTPE